MYDMVIVFMENKAGKLARITKALAENNINIYLSDIEDTGQFGIFKFLTDDPVKAKDILYNMNFTVALEKNVLVEMEDKVGGLAEIAQILETADISIKDALGCILEKNRKAILVIRCDEPESVEALMKINGLKTLAAI